MKLLEVKENKKAFLDLLLLADEEEAMVDRYLEKGTMYLLAEDGVKGECVVLDVGDGTLEIKNIAVAPAFHRKGYGKAMIDLLEQKYRGQYTRLQVGTGDSPATLGFYKACGFTRSHTVPNFFTDNYSHPIYEGGVLLRDMIYLQKPLSSKAPLPKGRRAAAVNSHGGLLRIVTSLTHPVSIPGKKGSLAKGSWRRRRLRDSQQALPQKHKPMWKPATLGIPPVWLRQTTPL